MIMQPYYIVYTRIKFVIIPLAVLFCMPASQILALLIAMETPPNAWIQKPVKHMPNVDYEMTYNVASMRTYKN